MQLRIAVVGAGAVGGTFGGLLALAGEDVSLLARGSHLEAIRERGLRLEGKQGDRTVEVRATDRPEEVGPVDLILMAVKSYDTRDAAGMSRPLLGGGTAVLSLQNGVENEEVIGSVLGMDRVLAGIAYVGAWITAPGTIRHELRGRIVLGEPGGGISRRAREMQALFEGAHIPCRVSPDIGSDKWNKLVGNSVLNVVPAVTGCRVGDLLGDACRERFLTAALEEAAAVGRAQGHRLPEGSIQGHLEFCRKYPDFETSTQQDARRGRPLETEALSGVVVRRGRERNVPVPIHSTLHRLLVAREIRVRRSGGVGGDPGSLPLS